MKSKSTVLKVYETVRTDYYIIALDVFAILGFSIALCMIIPRFRNADFDSLKLYLFLTFLCLALIIVFSYEFFRTYLRKIVLYNDCIQVAIGFKRPVIKYSDIEEMDIQEVFFLGSRLGFKEKYNTIILFFGDNKIPLLDEVYNPNDMGEILYHIFTMNPHIKCSQAIHGYLGKLNDSAEIGGQNV